jgi:Ca-activated chloride channel family protein
MFLSGKHYPAMNFRIIKSRGACCRFLCCAILYAAQLGFAESPFLSSCLAQTQQQLPELTPAPQQQQQRPRRVNPPQESAPIEQGTDQDEVLRIDTDLVLLDATVKDAGGRVVRGLRREDFKIYADGAEQPISFFNVEHRGGQPRPVAIVFALDVSGSMSPEELDQLGRAMRIFTARLSNNASVFAVTTFGMKVKTLQTFTSDAAKLERAFDRLSHEPNGLSTHTYDAVDDAVRMLVRNAPRTKERRLLKRAVIVVTDGFPVGDTVAPRTVIERANVAETSVYTVMLPSFSRLLVSAERAPLPTPLDVSGLAEKTGGTSVYATDKDFGALFQKLAEEVASTYVLAFYPPEAKRHDGRFHPVRIEAPPGLIVRQNRTGYEGAPLH